MNFLITGALGHVGSALIREYVKREDIELIRVLDNLSTQRYCSLFNLPKTHVKIEFIEGDINDLEILKKSMKGIDVVIHLAAITDAPSTVEKPEETRLVNLEGTKNVLEAAIEAGVKKFIFPSSTSVYGESEGLVDENTPMELLKPSSPYAEYKIKAEKLVQEANTRNGIQTFVLRKGTIFGESIGMRFHTAVNKFVWLACMNKPLTVWDSAINNKRPYLGLEDAIRAYEFVEKYGKPGELYNVLTDNYTIKDIVDSIKLYKPDLKIEITKSPLLNQKSYEVSNKKFKELGFEFKDSLKESLRKESDLLKTIDNSESNMYKKIEGKNILITGGAGFIGSNLALKLSSLNPNKIIIMDSLVEGLGGNIQNLNEIKNSSKVKICSGKEGDIKDLNKMKPIIKDVDIIFNLAGSTKHTKLDEKDLQFDTDVNFLSQTALLEACRQVMMENPDKKLTIVFAGTRDQYGKVPLKDLPVKEDYPPRTLTDYQSISKTAIESHHLILHSVLNELGRNIKISCLRVTNTYGPRQSSVSGAVIPVFIEKAAKGETIELWGRGEVVRDLNYIDDVVEAFLLLACSEKTGGEVYNLGCCIGKEDFNSGGVGGNLLTVRQLAETIVKIADKGEIRIIPYPLERKAVEPGYFASDISKIAELGWKPQISLEEGLKKTIEWFKSKN